jgi:Mycobacterium membrane protein
LANVTSTGSGAANDITPFNPKHLVLEVFGPPGVVATISYMDVNAQPQRVDDTALLWSYDIERREALFNRTGVRDHRRRAIAVARQKLGAA